jgi:histidinol-phosphate aminotransferase
LGHDLVAMRKAVTDRTRVVFVANPNNPTGTLASPTAVLDLVEMLPPHVLLVLDEAYIDFLSEPLNLLPLIRSQRKPNLLLTRTFSKIHGLAGLRVGYGLGSPELIAALEKVRQPFNLNAVAQAAALAALDDADHLRRTRENNASGLRFFAEVFRAWPLEFVPSAANFILVRVGNGQDVCAELQKRGVIVRPMGGYQLPEHIRISIGTPAENERCVAALKAVLAARQTPGR